MFTSFNAEDMITSKYLHARAKRPRTASDTAASHAFLAFLQGRTSGMRSMGECDVMSLDNAATTRDYVTILRARIRELETALESAQSQATAHAARMATMQVRLVATEFRANAAEARVGGVAMRSAKPLLSEKFDALELKLPATPSLDEAVRIVYGLYSREDSLCTGNGFFSLNMRPGAVTNIDELLKLAPGDRLFWAGCGNAPEVLSLAMSHPDVSFVAVDKNELAIRVGEVKRCQLGLKNITLRVADVMLEYPDDYTHVYSTAIAGPALYAKLRSIAGTGTICMFRSMMLGGHGDSSHVRSVCLSGSGEQRQLLSCDSAFFSSSD